MITERLQKINEYARRVKNGETLTPEEEKEREELRAEYIKEFRANLRGQLDQISIKNSDGSVVNLKDLHDQKYGGEEYSR